MFTPALSWFEVIFFFMGVGLIFGSYVFGFNLVKEQKPDPKGRIAVFRKAMDYAGFFIIMYLFMRS